MANTMKELLKLKRKEYNRKLRKDGYVVADW